MKKGRESALFFLTYISVLSKFLSLIMTHTLYNLSLFLMFCCNIISCEEKPEIETLQQEEFRSIELPQFDLWALSEENNEGLEYHRYFSNHGNTIHESTLKIESDVEDSMQILQCSYQLYTFSDTYNFASEYEPLYWEMFGSFESSPEKHQLKTSIIVYSRTNYNTYPVYTRHENNSFSTSYTLTSANDSYLSSDGYVYYPYMICQSFVNYFEPTTQLLSANIL